MWLDPLVVFAIVISLAWGLLGLIVHLVVAGIVGLIADAIVPGELPFGWLGAIAAGLIGSWLGRLLLGPIGPTIAGVPIISALIGAMILAFLVSLVKSATARRRDI